MRSTLAIRMTAGIIVTKKIPMDCFDYFSRALECTVA